MPWWLVLLNSLMGVSSAAAATVAVLRPALLAPKQPLSTNTLESNGAAQAARNTEHIRSNRFYPAMYAARAIPLGVTVAITVWFTPVFPLTQLVLAVAALAQLADIAIGFTCHQYGMAAGGAVAASCHLTGLVAVL